MYSWARLGLKSRKGGFLVKSYSVYTVAFVSPTGVNRGKSIMRIILQELAQDHSHSVKYDATVD